MPHDITQWLAKLGLSQYGEAFMDNAIGFEHLPDLDHETLREIGIQPVGHRITILKAAAALRTQGGIGMEVERRSADSSEAERRQLTVMFCDLVGSTRLSRKLDPEDLREINRLYQDTCKDAIEKHGGHIALFMGDGVLAYFGYPRAREDDAERAVRAGLGVVGAVKKLSVTRRNLVPPLEVRVGIATGPVVIGDLSGHDPSGKHTVVGETPNLAARLQGEAQPDSVVISTKTRQLAGELFRYIDRGLRNLKGIDEPVRIWLVTGEAEIESRFEAFHLADLTPLIGREHEIALLLDRWQQAKDGDGQVVFLSGEAGIGKSRLTQALRRLIVPGGAISLHYQCFPNHTGSALHPVIRQLARAGRIERNEQPDTKLDKLQSLLAGSVEDLEETLPLFAALMSIPADGRYQPVSMAPEQQKRKTLEALVARVKKLSGQTCVLAIFEDAHWSDPTSMEFLGLLIGETQSCRVLLVVTYRSEFTLPWTGHTHITSLNLNRFSRGRVVAMLQAITAGKALPEEVRDQIIEKTDGIPLFVEELTKTVLESGLVEDKGNHYALTGPLPPVAIPSTLHDSLMARLDRLPFAKETAQLAAVLGREFSYKLLAKISPLEEHALTDALAKLGDAGLVFARGTPPIANYSFKHAMVQEVAYESMLRAKRRELHKRAAAVLAEEDAEPEILAHHYSEAGLREIAVLYWLKAGQRGLERSANVEAVAHLRRGLELLNTMPRSSGNDLLELDYQLALGPALMAIKGYAAPEVGSVYAKGRELSSQLGNPSQLFAATWGLWLHYQQAGQLMKARELTDDLLAVAHRQANDALLLQAHHAAWATFHRLGELDRCYHHADQGMGLYDLSEHGSHAYVFGGHDPGVCAQTHAGIALWCLGFPDRALKCTSDALVLSERLLHPFSRSDALFGAARIRLFRREYSAARKCAKEMITLSREHGFSLQWAWGTVIHGSAVVSEHQSQPVIDDIGRGVSLARDTGAMAHVPYLLSLLADAYRRTGRVHDGLRTIADAMEIIERTGERNWEAELWRLKGELLKIDPVRKQLEAECCFRRALEIARTQKALSLELRSAMSIARLWRDQDRHEAGCDLLMPIRDRFTEGLSTPDMQEVDAFLGKLTQG